MITTPLMKQITKRELNKMTANFYHSPYANQKPVVKLFHPALPNTYYLVAFDDEHNEFYGAADLGYGLEYGCIPLSDLMCVGAMGMGLEKEKYWKANARVFDLMHELEAGEYIPRPAAIAAGEC